MSTDGFDQSPSARPAGSVPMRLVEMTAAERFWYVLMCIGFGGGYFAKIPVAKALSELPQYRSQRQADLGTLGR